MSRCYLWVNVIVILLTLIFIGSQERSICDVSVIYMDEFPLGIFILLCTVLLVQVIKGVRLYFELYEKKMDKGLFVRQYCKVVPVSMILPGKLGDLFRAYCFGYHIKDYMAGVSVIILDRFVDTLGLVTVMMAFFLMYNVVAQKLFILLIFVLLMLLAMYVSFPGMSRYWSHYLLIQPASSTNLNRLRLLRRMQRAYWELQQVIRGKFLIVYLLSLLAWSIEIGRLALYCKWLTGESVRQTAETYLGSAISGKPSAHLVEFIGVSVVILLIMYLLAVVRHYGRERLS